MERIKIQKKIGTLGYIILYALSIALILFLIQAIVYIYNDNANISDKLRMYIAIAVIIILISTMLLPKLTASQSDKNNYLSEILIADDFINLIYKSCDNKITDCAKIVKDDIKRFFIDAKITSKNIFNFYAVSEMYECYLEGTLELNNGEIIKFNYDSKKAPFEMYPHHVFLDFIKHKDLIPNFDYKLNTSSTYIQNEIYNIINSSETEEKNKKILSLTLLTVFTVIIVVYIIILCIYVFN